MILNADKIRESANARLADLIRQDGIELRNAGTRLTACCPFHDEKTPSFFVSPVRGTYKCFGCGTGGDAVEWVIQRHRLSFPEAILKLSDFTRIPAEMNGQSNEEWKAAAKKEKDEREKVIEKNTAAILGQRPETQLGKRGLSEETAQAFHVFKTNLPGEYLPCRSDHERYIFPIHNRQGKVAGFAGRVGDKAPKDAPKYLNSKESPAYQKSELLYGLFQNQKAILKTRTAYVVEGYFDVLTPHSNGLQNHVAPCGTAFGTKQAELLARYAETLVFVFDGDQAGRDAARKSVPVAAPHFEAVYVVFLPEKYDPDSLIREQGKEAYQRIIEDDRKDGLEWWIFQDWRPGDNAGKRAVLDRARQILRPLPPDVAKIYVPALEKALEMPDLLREIRRPDDADRERETLARVSQEIEHLKKSGHVPPPMDALPAPIQYIFSEWNRAYLLPNDYFLAGGLVAACAAIGSKFAVERRFGERHHAVLNVALVGISGMGKTPALKLCLEPIYGIEAELQMRNMERVAAWKQELHEWKNSQSKGPEPAKPKDIEIIMNDFRLEALQESLSENKMGLLATMDEITGIIAGLDNLGMGGNARAFFLSVYDSVPFKVTRQSRRLFCLRPILSLIGGTQPGVLSDLAAKGNLENGLFPRFIYPFPHEMSKPYETDANPDPNTFPSWKAIIEALWKLPFRKKWTSETERDNNKVDESTLDVDTTILRLSPEANDLYKKWNRANTDAINAQENDNVQSLLTKFESRTLRFSLILHLLELACTCVKNNHTPELEEFEKLPALTTIPPETMQAAIRLTEYFIFCGMKALNRVASPSAMLKPEQQVWYETLPETFSTKDALRVASVVKDEFQKNNPDTKTALGDRTIKSILLLDTLFRRTGQGVYVKKA